MRKFDRLLLALACPLLISTSAIAAPVKFEYSGIVAIAWSQTGSESEWGVAKVDDYRIVIGSTVRGFFSYDTDTPASTVRWSDNFFYQGGAGSMSVHDTNSGFRYTSTASDFPQVVIENNNVRYGGPRDSFGMSSHTSDPAFPPPFSATIGFFDPSGLAFDSRALPTSLDLRRFSQSSMIFNHERTGHSSQFAVNVDTLRQVSAVPEPVTPAIIFTGLGLIAAARRFCQSKR